MAPSAAVARVISPDKSVVNLVVNAVLATSAALARVISPDKLAETSKVNEFAFVLRVFTTVVNATKSPETSLINASINASFAVARVVSFAKFVVIVPNFVVIVAEKLLSSPNARANSFNVSNATGAPANISPIRIWTNSVVAICPVLTELEAVGAVGIPVKEGDIIFAFVVMLVVIFPTLLETSLIKARFIFSTAIARVISPDKSVVNLVVNVVFADSATVARTISPDKSVVNFISAASDRLFSVAKFADTSKVNALKLVLIFPTLLETSLIKVRFIFSTAIARVISPDKSVVNLVDNAVFADSAASERLFSVAKFADTSKVNALKLVLIFPTLLETSLINTRFTVSALVARIISPDKSVVILLFNVVFADSAIVARTISPDKSVVNFISAASERLFSVAKFAETSKVNEFAFVLRVFTTVVNATKSPEISLINASINASFVVARVVSFAKFVVNVPNFVVIVAEKLLSSPKAAANSFNVSNATGAPANISPMRVCTNAVVASWVLSVVLIAVGAVGIPVNAAESVFAFVDIRVLIVTIPEAKLEETSPINAVFAPSAAIARLTSVAKFAETSIVNAPELVVRLLTTVVKSAKSPETSLIIVVLAAAAVMARVISASKLEETSPINVAFATAVAVARVISPDKSLVNLVVNAVVNAVFAPSAAIARLTSAAKFAETSMVNALELVVRVFTTVVNATKSPEISLINASINASFVVARVVSFAKFVVNVPNFVVIVAEKLLSSPNAAANSFNVSNATGAPDNISPMRVCTNAVVAIWVLSVVLFAVGAVGIPVNAAESAFAFVDIRVLTVTIFEAKLEETSPINAVFAPSAAIARLTSVAKFAETSIVNAPELVVRLLTTVVKAAKSPETSLIIVVFAASAVTARVISSAKLEETSPINVALLLIVPTITLFIKVTVSFKLEETSLINAFEFVLRVLTVVFNVFKLEETSKVKEEFADSAINARFFSLINVLDISVTKALVSLSAAIARYFSTTILLETSNTNALFAASFDVARIISLANPLVTVVILVAFVVSAAVARVISAAKLDDTSNTKVLLLLLLELTKAATVFKFPDKSLINASSKASSVSARDFSVVKLEETSPI